MDCTPRFLPVLNRTLLTFPNNEPAKYSDIYSALMKDKDYTNKRGRDCQFRKRSVYYWLEQHYKQTRIGKILKNGKTSLKAPLGIIVVHPVPEPVDEPDPLDFTDYDYSDCN